MTDRLAPHGAQELLNKLPRFRQRLLGGDLLPSPMGDYVKLADVEALLRTLLIPQEDQPPSVKNDVLRTLASGLRKVLTPAEIDLIIAEIQRGIARDARLAEPEDTGPHGPAPLPTPPKESA